MKWRKAVLSSRANLCGLRDEAVAVLRGWGLTSEDLLFELEVILCELLSNAAEHGNSWQEEQKVALAMRYLTQAGMLLLFVADRGGKTITPGAEVEEWAETGRGLFLVTSLAGSCRFGKGRVWLRKEVGHGEEALNRR